MDKIKLCIYLVLFTAGMVQAQVDRYMVFFTDKNGTPYSIENPETFLSTRAIERRTSQSISVTDQDLPITPGYVQGIRDEGITVLYKTKWLNGVLVECNATGKTILESLPYVSSVELVAPGSRPSASGRKRSSGKFKVSSSVAAITDEQISMLGMDRMHMEGYHGEGMLVAIMDAGFPGANVTPFFSSVFDEGRFDAQTSYDFVSGGADVFRHSNHGTEVWSTLAGFKENEFSGGAYKASYILFVTEHAPTEYRVEEYNWLFAAERADSAGVDVINTSLGYNTFDDPAMNYTVAQMNGVTAVITRAAEMAASKGIAVVVSAGNEGNVPSWQIITAPADGASVLAVGAVTSSGVKTSTSSIGPSADGRIKPDVAALGSGVAVINSSGNIASSSGTSFAAPLTTSLVIGVWQMLPELTVKQLFDTIRNRSSQFSTPDFQLGYGIPNFISVITGVDPELQGKDFVTIFPNPASHEIFIEFLNREPGSQVKFSLTDSKGVIDYKVPVSQQDLLKFSMDISAQQPGLYVLRVQQGKRLSMFKIIKIE